MAKIYIGNTLVAITPGSTEAAASYTKAQTDQKITDLIDGAPETLNTLNEIADGIGNLKLDSLADVEIKDGKVGTVDTIGSGSSQMVAGTYSGVSSTSAGVGTGATFDVVLTAGLIDSVTVTGGQGPARPDNTYAIGATQYEVERGGSAITTATGATFSIVTVSGIATITITNPGSAYVSGDIIKVPNSNLGNVSGVPDLTFSVTTTTSSADSVTVSNSGTGYVVDETISIAEENLGYDGSAGTGTEPLTFDVATLADAGIMIYDATAAGTKADPHFINKTLNELGIISNSSPVFTGDVTFDTNTLFVDSTNNRVGVGTTTPGVKFVVQGNSRFNGDLTVDTSTLHVDSTNNRVGIGTASPTAGSILSVSGKSRFAGDILLPNTNKALIKNNCYNKTGAIRLQKAAADSDELSMRYEGANSNNFVLQQISAVSGSTANRGQIKFIAAIPAGQTNATQSAIRLDAQNVDVGFSNTNLIKLFSDTNVGANKKLIFTDTRLASHGLQFYHTGVRPNTSGEAGRDAIQMGMYGSSGDANIGEFKITHKVGTAANTDVLSVTPAGTNLRIHKPAFFSNSASFEGDCLFDSTVDFEEDINVNAGLLGLSQLGITSGGVFSVDTNVLYADGILNKVGINHTPTSSSSTFTAVGSVTVEEGGEKGLLIQPGNYSYKIGDMDIGDVGSHLEINAASGVSKFHNTSVGINRTPNSGKNLDVAGTAQIENLGIENDFTSGGDALFEGSVEIADSMEFSGGGDLEFTSGGNISGSCDVDVTGSVQSEKWLRPGVYATTAARDAAIPSPAAGMMVFVTQFNTFQGYTGSAWVNFH